MSKAAETPEERELKEDLEALIRSGNARSRRRALRAGIPILVGAVMALLTGASMVWLHHEREVNNAQTVQRGFGLIVRPRGGDLSDIMGDVLAPIGVGVAGAAAVAGFLAKRAREEV